MIRFLSDKQIYLADRAAIVLAAPIDTSNGEPTLGSIFLSHPDLALGYESLKVVFLLLQLFEGFVDVVVVFKLKVAPIGLIAKVN